MTLGSTVSTRAVATTTVAATARRGTSRRRRTRNVRHLLVFLGPATFVYTALVIYPILGSARLSLYTDIPGQGRVWVGLGNFQRLITDDYWSQALGNALGNTAVWLVLHLVLQTAIGLVLALLLTSPRLRLRGLLRTVIFTPTVISIVIIGFAWKLILSPLWGVTPEILGAMGLGDLYQPWLGKENTALITLALISVWQNVGIPMLLFTAALLGIGDELLEAARVDGANARRMFFSIQLPLILPTIGIVSILTFVGASRAFDLIYAVQGSLAGPDYSTDVTGTLFYRTLGGFFTEIPNPTMASTIATVITAVVGVVVAVYLFTIQRRLQRFEA